jgi:hypothetical protein
MSLITEITRGLDALSIFNFALFLLIYGGVQPLIVEIYGWQLDI